MQLISLKSPRQVLTLIHDAECKLRQSSGIECFGGSGMDERFLGASQV
jgi:hypothetical protein